MLRSNRRNDMFTYISIEEFADCVVKNNKYTKRKELIA